MSKNFAPWKQDLWIAFFLWGAGFIWLALSIAGAFRINNFYAMLLGFGSIFPFYYGFSFQESNHRRKHGVEVEKNALLALKNAKPEEWQVYSDWDMISCDANIDVVVRMPNAERVSVEIKSWHDWKRKGYIKRRKAKNQVLWQCDEMATDHAFIWLPEAKRQKIIRERQSRKGISRPVIIVQGEVGNLLSAMRSCMRHGILVHFPVAPPVPIRTFLKRKHQLKWEKEYFRWAGHCTEAQIEEIKKTIDANKGKLTVLKRY